MIDSEHQIIHHGAIDGVTGSCHELRWQDSNNDLQGILIDCGLFQGAEVSNDGSTFDQLKINFPIEHIQALVVTHVHIDHVGRIPYLLAAGFKGPIYCSKPSAKLLPLVLEDALKIGFTKNHRLIEKFLQQIDRQLQPLEYGTWEKIKLADLNVRLNRAGHILGSAYVEIELDSCVITFSGDLGPPETPLLFGVQSPEKSDVLVLESTYGDKQHESRSNRVARLQSIVEKCVENRGVVLIPAFSIGRTQELLYEIEEIITHNSDDEVWNDIEVIIDSPLAAKFTETYKSLRKYWDEEARQRLTEGRHPLSFESLLTIDDHETHIQTVEYLAKTARPTIVLAASGMCTGGRVVNYLKALLEDERTDILFVGYQAQGTAGRTIQKYGPRNGYVILDGKKYTISAQVHTIGGYSAHADQKDLINFVKDINDRPAEIRLIHGDEAAKSALKIKLTECFPEINTWIP
ncbi:MAG: MBL fold metallo-hydrolase [Gammaproteobacteria bacterium]|nr:MBL fold metallo-hydrolase [Gammaproteobacteria bacterium]